MIIALLTSVTAPTRQRIIISMVFNRGRYSLIGQFYWYGVRKFRNPFEIVNKVALEKHMLINVIMVTYAPLDIGIENYV